MARDDKQMSYEETYKSRMAIYKEIYKERTDFASKFKLKPEKTKGYYTIGDPAASVPAGAASNPASGKAGTVSGNDNKEKVWNYFASLGFTEAAVAGVMGNVAVETGDTFNPKILQGGRGPGTGIIQWENRAQGGSGRWNELLAWAKGQNRDPWAIETQLDWLWKEMQARHLTADTYGKKTSVEDATTVFEKKVEAAGKPNMPKRIQYANSYLAKYGKGSAGGKAVTTNGGTSAKSLSFQVVRDIASIKEEGTSDTVTEVDYAGDTAELIVHAPIGTVRSGRFIPPDVDRIGYVANRLHMARENKWQGWSPLDNNQFVHLAGVQENFYSPEAQKAFLLLYRSLEKDKLKVINGFEAKQTDGIWNTHNVGMAMDIYVDNIYDAIYVADTAWTVGFRAIAIGGERLDEYNPGFVHIDCGPKAFWPLNHHDVYKGPGTLEVKR